MIELTRLSNGKRVYIEGDSVTQDEALELANSLVAVWGVVHPFAKAVILYEVEPVSYSNCPHYDFTKDGLIEGLKMEMRL